MSSWSTIYPRPLLRRDSFLPLAEGWTLNGKPIRMPYPPQSPLSGYDGEIGDTLRYETAFTLPEGFCPAGYQVMLHFGAVDQTCAVFLNGMPIAQHEGGYLPFSACLDKALKAGENTLSVVAEDTLNHDYPYGKQRKKRGGMWYTPVSGIWQTVWLEAVPQKHITGLRVTPDLTGICLEIQGAQGACDVEVRYQGEMVATAVQEGQKLRIDVPPAHRHLWTPQEPCLYDLTVRARSGDVVQSYFALRTVEVRPARRGVARVCLNGKPVLMNGVLDQGYFPDGIYLPEDPQEFERDVRRMKELGFNMLRKHIKVEPECFYEACDRLGMLVVQDMVNNGGYNYLFDTVLPTIGFQRRPNWPVSRRRKEIFQAHAEATIAHLYSHPCVVAWTIFNEGWGQFDADRLYRELKQTDPTRLYDTASGWFKPKASDFDSRHVYFRNKRLKPGKRPLFLSECGGYARKIPDHLWNPANEYGYGKTDTEEQLTAAIGRLYAEMVNPAIPGGLCGVVYTQLSDVEDEINGLYTYDRQVCKVNAGEMRRIMQEAEKLLEDASKKK